MSSRYGLLTSSPLTIDSFNSSISFGSVTFLNSFEGLCFNMSIEPSVLNLYKSWAFILHIMLYVGSSLTGRCISVAIKFLLLNL